MGTEATETYEATVLDAHDGVYTLSLIAQRDATNIQYTPKDSDERAKLDVCLRFAKTVRVEVAAKAFIVAVHFD